MEKLSRQFVPWKSISDTMGENDYCVIVTYDEVAALVLVGRYEGDLCWPEYAVVEVYDDQYSRVSWESQYPTAAKVSAVAFWLMVERLGLYT